THHIVTDGWSVGIFQRELSALYQALVDGQPSPLPQLPIQYTEYSIWQREWFEGDVYQSQLAYWKKQFATLPPVLELSADHPRPSIQAYRAFRGAQHTISLSKQLTHDLKQLCRKENVTLFMTLMAAHQDLPFERLVKELQPERTLAHNPLFQVMFVLQSEDIQPLQLKGLEVEHFRVGNIMANFDLTLDIVERDEQLVCLFESNADLFESDTVERLMGHFQNLLEGIVANPEQKISELPLLSEAERRKLLVEWNDTRTDYPANKCIQELFEQQVERTPDAVALICDNRQLSYRELNSQANRLAHYLRKCGVAADTRVAICMQRSPEMIVALLAILKAGGAYVPLDP